MPSWNRGVLLAQRMVLINNLPELESREQILVQQHLVNQLINHVMQWKPSVRRYHPALEGWLRVKPAPQQQLTLAGSRAASWGPSGAP